MKKKWVEIFILVILWVVALGLLCLSGCTSNFFEGIMFANAFEEDMNVVGISIPGCGSCLSSKKVYTSACWPQAIKMIAGSVGEETQGNSLFYLGCDNQYYESGGLGNGEIEQSCYSGLIYGEQDTFVLFYGMPREEEKVCGVIYGCVGCIAGDAEGKEVIKMIERWLGID